MTDTPKSGHNKISLSLELTEELRQFIILNCEANLRMNMQAIQAVHDGKMELSDKTIHILIDYCEKFRELKRLAENAR